jgi:Flp pilus assembly pilin Flp
MGMKRQSQELGQAATEYALLLLLVGGVVIFALAWLGQKVSDSFAEVNDCLVGAKYALVNGSFEEDALITSNWRAYDAAAITGWETTAGDNKIEIWYTGFLGVPAPDGRYLAELNANQPSALYQDIDSVPGERLTWSFYHRGRSGVDTMEVRIGAPGATVSQKQFSTDKTWTRYEGLYEVPEGQTLTRFEFAAIRTANGNLSVGNLLDDVQFGSACGYEEEPAE